MSERVPCQICGTSILEVTAKYNDGFCAPCVQAKARKEREEFIRQNKKDVDLYSGVDSDVEIIKIMHRPKKYNPLINYLPYQRKLYELYRGLNEQEVQELVNYAIELIEDEDQDQAEYILIYLACLTDADLDKALEVCIQNEIFYPEGIYRECGEGISEILIDKLKSGWRYDIPSVLAYGKSEQVTNFFNELESNEPEETKGSSVRAHEHSHGAGWTLSSNTRRSLVFPKAFGVVNSRHSGEELAEQIAVRAGFQKLEEKCSACNAPLSILFDIDLNDPNIDFISLNQERLRVLNCPNCSCYGVFYARFENDHVKAHPLNKNSFSQFDPNDLEYLYPQKVLKFSSQERSIYSVNYWFDDMPLTQLGGFPSWIQDSIYPKCIDCNETMKFLGQVSNDDISLSEGIFYAHICLDCKVTCVHYQQT